MYVFIGKFNTTYSVGCSKEAFRKGRPSRMNWIAIAYVVHVREASTSLLEDPSSVMQEAKQFSPITRVEHPHCTLYFELGHFIPIHDSG